MKVIVLGGDGFCGWPCAVNLAEQNHDVIIVDNLSRRKIDIDLEVESLTPISSITERLSAWEETGGCLLYTSPSPRDKRQSRMPSSA